MAEPDVEALTVTIILQTRRQKKCLITALTDLKGVRRHARIGYNRRPAHAAVLILGPPLDLRYPALRRFSTDQAVTSRPSIPLLLVQISR